MHCGIHTIYAMYAIYLLSKGLDIFQMCLVHATFYGMLAAFEIPTGAIADRNGRMTAVAMSCVLFIACMATFAYTNDFVGFAAAATLRALAQALANGASDSWIRDALRQNGESNDRSRDVFFEAEKRKHAWGIAAALGGAVLVDLYGMRAAWILGIAFYFAALLVALYSMREERAERKLPPAGESKKSLLLTMEMGVRYARSSTNICFVTWAAVAFAFAIATPNIIWQPFFQERLPEWLAKYQSSLGVLWALAMFFHLAGIWIASKLGTSVDARKVLLICGFITAIGMIATAIVEPLGFIVVVYLIHQTARGPFDPWRRTYAHNNINKPEVEATVVSWMSVLQHLSNSVGLIVAGLAAKYVSMNLSWGVAGVVLFAFVAVLWKDRNEK